MTNKQRYASLCQKEERIPIFSQYWWLNSVCGEKHWDVALFEKGGQIWASLPYFMKKHGLFNVISMPKLTQSMGVYIKYPPGQKYYKRLSWEKECCESLISQLPKADAFSQNFSQVFSNWLPFYWGGYEQITRYTYVLESMSIDTLEQSFLTDTRRRKVKQARKSGVRISESRDLKAFYELNGKTYRRQGLDMPYDFQLIERIFEACTAHDACKLYIAEDPSGNIVASGFFVYDCHTVYYLMGGIDPDKKEMGGMDLLLLESIRFAMDTGRVFDFEGSMIESIEKYFRSFGAVQRPYFRIMKTEHRFLKLLNAVKKLMR